MASLEEFAKRMFQLGANVEANAPKLVRKVALAVDAAVVIATPVDTGRARSNWIVETGKPARVTIEPYVAGSFGSTGAANVAAQIEHAKQVLSRVKQGDIVYISNNLKYIGKLNAGWSKQAPAGFVEAAARAAAVAVAGSKVTVSNFKG